MLGILKIDQEYEFEVVKITPAAECFENKYKGGAMTYCHYLFLVDPLDRDLQYKCQICDENDTQEYCKVKDTIRIVVRRFTRAIHTVELISNNNTVKSSNTTKEQVLALIKNQNPIVGATAAAVALNAAVNYWSVRGDDDSATGVIETAEKFFTFLIDKHNNPL